MLPRFKLITVQFFSNPNYVKTVLILSTLVLAALAGAAPHDHGS